MFLDITEHIDRSFGTRSALFSQIYEDIPLVILPAAPVDQPGLLHPGKQTRCRRRLYDARLSYILLRDSVMLYQIFQHLRLPGRKLLPRKPLKYHLRKQRVIFHHQLVI